MFVCVIPTFSVWAYLSPMELYNSSEVVAEATVKLPKNIAKRIGKDGTILDLQSKLDIVVPVTFVLKNVLKGQDILKNGQNKIEMDIVIEKEDSEYICGRTVGYRLSDGETAIFLFDKTEKGLRLKHYPTYSLDRDFQNADKNISVPKLDKKFLNIKKKLSEYVSVAESFKRYSLDKYITNKIRR